MNGVLIGCFYAPNGNPQPGPKFDYKLAWMERFNRHAADALQAPACRSCWRATINVVPTDLRHLPDQILRRRCAAAAASRARCSSACSTQGWIDAIRTLHPDAPMYTFWDYMRNRWQRDAGLRLDHLLLSPELPERLVAAGVDRDVRGEDRRQRSCAGLDRAARATAARRAAAKDRRSAAAKAKAPRKAPPQASAQSRDDERRPLLVIDGDYFAHRSYHALPKTILRQRRQAGGRDPRLRQFPAAASTQAEQPRAVLVGVGHARRADLPARGVSPTIRAAASSTTRCVEQLDALAGIRRGLRLRQRQGGGLRGRRFPRRRGRRARRSAAARRWSRAATATRSSSPPNAPPSSIRCAPARSRASTPAEVRARYGVDPAAGAGLHRAARRSVRQAAGRARRRRRRARPICCAATARWKRARGRPLRRSRPRSCGCIVRSPPWTARRRCRALRDQTPTWDKAAALAREWGLNQLADRFAAMAGAKASAARLMQPFSCAPPIATKANSNPQPSRAFRARSASFVADLLPGTTHRRKSGWGIERPIDHRRLRRGRKRTPESGPADWAPSSDARLAPIHGRAA